jgi:hypothetical protein
VVIVVVMVEAAATAAAAASKRHAPVDSGGLSDKRWRCTRCSCCRRCCGLLPERLLCECVFQSVHFLLACSQLHRLVVKPLGLRTRYHVQAWSGIMHTLRCVLNTTLARQ